MAVTANTRIVTTTFGTVCGINIDADQTLGSGNVGQISVSESCTLTLPTVSKGYLFKIVPIKPGIVITFNPQSNNGIQYPPARNNSVAVTGRDLIWTVNKAGRTLLLRSWNNTNWYVNFYNGDLDELRWQP